MPTIFRLKITLRHIKPAIFRRILVPGNMRLDEFCEYVLYVMGWERRHLFSLTTFGDPFYPTPDLAKELGGSNMGTKKVQDCLKVVKQKSTLLYDFGDGWEHEIVVEDIHNAVPGEEYPICTGGKRLCPPEDCGGVGGYYHLLEVMADPTHPDYADMLYWLGGEPYDPNASPFE